MQQVTLTGAEIAAGFGLLMPAIVAFMAGIIRQDRFPSWLNELISYVLIIGLAAIQTYLGGNFGGSVSNFILVAAWSVAGLHTRFGQQLQGSVQTATSIAKLPPQPPPQPPIPVININVDQLAAVLLDRLNLSVLAASLKDELLKSQPPPVDAQPTQQMAALQIVRDNTPPQGG